MKVINFGKRISFLCLALAISLAFSLMSQDLRAEPKPGSPGATCGKGAAACPRYYTCCGLTKGGNGSGTCKLSCGKSIISNTTGVTDSVGSPTVMDGGTSGSGSTVTNVEGIYRMSDGSLQSCKTTVTKGSSVTATSQCEPVQVINVEAAEPEVADSIMKSQR